MCAPVGFTSFGANSTLSANAGEFIACPSAVADCRIVTTRLSTRPATNAHFRTARGSAPGSRSFVRSAVWAASPGSGAAAPPSKTPPSTRTARPPALPFDGRKSLKTRSEGTGRALLSSWGIFFSSDLLHPITAIDAAPARAIVAAAASEDALRDPPRRTTYQATDRRRKRRPKAGESEAMGGRPYYEAKARARPHVDVACRPGTY